MTLISNRADNLCREPDRKLARAIAYVGLAEKCKSILLQLALAPLLH
jgi:hypothetical protein